MYNIWDSRRAKHSPIYLHIHICIHLLTHKFTQCIINKFAYSTQALTHYINSSAYKQHLLVCVCMCVYAQIPHPSLFASTLSPLFLYQLDLILSQALNLHESMSSCVYVSMHPHSNKISFQSLCLYVCA